MVYKLAKRLIEIGNYDKDDLTNKLDIFLLGSRITQEQYNELIGLINQ